MDKEYYEKYMLLQYIRRDQQNLVRSHYLTSDAEEYSNIIMLQVSILFEGAEQPVNSVQQAIYVITPRQLDETLIHVTV